MAGRRPPRRTSLTRRPAAPAGPDEVVRIERIAAGGDGIGHLQDGRAVFVPRSAPGDEVELTKVARQRSFARAEIGRLLVPGPLRTAPRCPHYERDRCGGCQLQHLTSEAQRDVRRAIVGDALRRVGRLEVADPELDYDAVEWGYRSRITVHPDASGRKLGFHRLGRPGDIFDLERCLLAAPPLQSLWDDVRTVRRLLPRGLESITLRMERGGIRHLVVRGRDAEWPESQKFAEALRIRAPDAVAWWHPEGGAPRVLGGLEAFPATVFEQVNPPMGDRARHWALAALGDVRGQHGWDLYAGIGETSRALIATGATVESVELDRRAVRLALSLGPGAPALVPHAGAVEEVVASLRAPTFVVTNPPRTGMHPQATAGIAATAARRMAYISCDPATLARDIRGLGEGWRLSALRAFDLFPQTAHVETVALLERE